MYHYVREFNPKFPNFRYLDVKNFRKQISFFKKNYGFVDKDEWLEFIEYGKVPKDKNKILLTFDDAMICHYDYVFQELLSNNLWGTFYVPTNPYSENKILDVHRIHLLCGAYNGKDLINLTSRFITDEMVPDKKKPSFKNKTYTSQKNYEGISEFKRILNYYIDYKYRTDVIDNLSNELGFEYKSSNFYVPLDALKEMKSSGMVIGSHSSSHPLMSKLDYTQQKKEICKSIDILDELLDKKLKTYCHPYGGKHSFNQDTINILTELGFKYSFMVEPRHIIKDDLNESIFYLPRYDCNMFMYGKAS